MDIIVPRGTSIMRNGDIILSGKRYRVKAHHVTQPDGSGWQGEVMWAAQEPVVVWVGSGNLWMQARLSEVIVLEETPENEPQAD